VKLLSELNLPKVIGNSVPGLLFAVTLYMMVDIASGRSLTAEAFGGNIEVAAASAASLLGLSTMLGIFIDAIGHAFFEEPVKSHLPSFKQLEHERDARLRALGRSPDDFHPIYRVQVDKELRDGQIEAQYRFTEFTINGTLALVPLTVVFPLYALEVLEVALWTSFGIAVGLATFTAMMFWAAVENMTDWEKVRADLVFGTLNAPPAAAEEEE